MPSDACAGAPFANLNGFILSTAGFTPGGDPGLDDCLPINWPGWTLASDLWVKFVPQEIHFTFLVEKLTNFGSDENVQALIYKECAGEVLECSPECSNRIVFGGGITYDIGDSYLLRIRKCDGAIGPLKISTNKTNAVKNFIQTFNPALPATGLIIGAQKLNCVHSIRSYSMPLNVCAPGYIWRIETENAVFVNFDSEQTVDLNPNRPMTQMLYTSNTRNNVNIQYFDPKIKQIRLTAQLFNGTDSTTRTAFYIAVDSVEYLQKSIVLCHTAKVYADASLPGSPFLLSDTCGVTKQYKVLYDESGCRKNLTLNLIKDCDTIVPVALIVKDTVLCANYHHSIEINNFSSKFQYDWIQTSDSVLVNISGQMMHCLFFHPGKYNLVLKVSNACLSDTFKYHFTVDDQLPTPYIHGLKVVTQKSTQTYCVYSPTPDVIWKSSKGLKYKQYYKNGQSCIAVTFAKLTNTGWLIASHSNSCGTEKDSIYVFVKPKTSSAEEVPIHATSDQIETRQGDSFSNAVLELFPSPAKDLLQIKCNQPYNRVRCTDLLGRSVELKPSELSTYSISFLRPGLYQISIYKERHRIATQKFVKID